MKRSIYIVGIVGIILIIATASNPKKEQHIEKLKQVITQTLNEKPIDSLSLGSTMMNFGSMLGVAFGFNPIDQIVLTMVEVDDYVLFSLTKIAFGNEKSIVAVGVFGNVFILPKVKDKISEFIDGKSELKMNDQFP